jgi:16S rRNA (guanine(527)-N(7))-methyltransferase RsmG
MSRDQVNEFRSALDIAVSSFGLNALLELQAAQLEKHYTMLLRWNRRVNLTRITRPAEAATLHYAESLFGARFITDERRILDIGSGAGFPAIPLAVIRPDLHVTALEANRKKSLFLREAADELQLTNLSIITARLEEFNWTGYELVTSRALERAEFIFRAVLEEMSAIQRLMLYCASDLASSLAKQVQRKLSIETHAIPHSRARIIAILSTR